MGLVRKAFLDTKIYRYSVISFKLGFRLYDRQGLMGMNVGHCKELGSHMQFEEGHTLLLQGASLWRLIRTKQSLKFEAAQ